MKEQISKIIRFTTENHCEGMDGKCPLITYADTPDMGYTAFCGMNNGHRVILERGGTSNWKRTEQCKRHSPNGVFALWTTDMVRVLNADRDNRSKFASVMKAVNSFNRTHERLIQAIKGVAIDDNSKSKNTPKTNEQSGDDEPSEQAGIGDGDGSGGS